MQQSVDSQIEAETRLQRRVARVQANKEFMDGVREGLASWMRGDQPTPSKYLKRKYGG